MLRKKFIFENDDSPELNDFQKILAINKRRIHPSDIDFETSDGKDFSDVIDIDYDGIHFKFDGLEEFLKFFFPDVYGEDSGDGEYDAVNYDAMYRNRWDWYDEYSNRSYDDWNEGFVVDAFRSESLKRLKEILDIATPELSNFITDNNGKFIITNENGKNAISSFLESFGFDDEIQDVYVSAQADAVSGEVPKYIEKTYCNCLTEIGIENWSERYCFWRYFMDWGSAILLFARFGTENDKFLDLLFEAINKTNVSHLPEYYEISYNVWDEEAFTHTFVSGVGNILNNLEEKILEEGTYSEEYFEILNKIIKIGGFNTWIQSKNKKLKIKIDKINPETLKIDFSISEKNWVSKRGRTTIDDIINLLYNESLFDSEEFREHYLKFLNKSVL